MYEWKVFQTTDDGLERELNVKQQEGWEIFSIVQTPIFNQKVMGASLPGEIIHNLVLRKSNAKKN